MNETESNKGMKYFQIRILHEQAKHLPGHLITKHFKKLELVAGTGVIDSISTSIVKVEHDGIEIMDIKEELKGSLIIDKVLQEGKDFAYLKVKTPGPIQMIISAEEEVLIPKQMDMRISKILIGDWMTAPNLPSKRTLVIKTAVGMGYYSVPRSCNQSDIAEVLGIKQGTVAEHLQHAESLIINSWGQQTSLSEPSD
jgi:predicted DNA binding protein